MRQLFAQLWRRRQLWTRRMMRKSAKSPIGLCAMGAVVILFSFSPFTFPLMPLGWLIAFLGVLGTLTILLAPLAVPLA